MLRLLKIVTVIAAVGASIASARAGWFSDETPPAGAKPLSEVIRMLEDQGVRTITEIEFEDGVWKIEVHQPDGTEVDLKVDPMTGQIRSRK
jgi:uncharacterized membrane protein YkoI